MRDDDSSADEPIQSDLQKIEEKNRILLEKLYKSDKENKGLKELVNMIQNGDQGPLDNKDKRILELAARNRDQTVKIEVLKNKATRAMEEVNRLKMDPGVGRMDISETTSNFTSEKTGMDNSENL